MIDETTIPESTTENVETNNNLSDALETKILELETKLAEAESAKLRTLADLENFRRRESESRASWSHDAVANWIKQLIPTIAELQLGAEHTTDEDVKNVITKFNDNLLKLGLEKINPEPGTTADHNLHEVLMTAEGEPGTVVQVLEPGWKLGETVIIPAKISGAPLS